MERERERERTKMISNRSCCFILKGGNGPFPFIHIRNDPSLPSFERGKPHTVNEKPTVLSVNVHISTVR